jgi:hypothetical protein
MLLKPNPAMLKPPHFPVTQTSYNLRNRTILIPDFREIKILWLRRINTGRVVDLSEYVNLERLICNGTDVEDIICFPQTLKILWCSGTKITKLHHLPDSLIFIQCDNKMYFDRLHDSLQKIQFIDVDTGLAEIYYREDFETFKTKYHDRFIEESDYILK